MNIEYKGKSYNLKWSFRALMIYENITKKSFSPKTISDVIIFFYSILCASAKGDTIQFDDFMNYVDENPQSIAEFSEWLRQVFESQNVLSPQEELTDAQEKEAQDNIEKN